MLKRLLALVAVLALALPASGAARLNRNESSLLQEMNRVRLAHGLHRLGYDPNLERAARAHSRTMLRTNSFGHGALGSRFRQFGVTASLAGENLAWSTGASSTARAIVVAWLASSAHRANLLRPSFTRVGVGALVGAFLGLTSVRVVTADFAG